MENEKIIDGFYASSAIGGLYFGNIKEDMSIFSEIAKEIDTTLENVLLYTVIAKLNQLCTNGNGTMGYICETLDEIKKRLRCIR